MKLKLISFTGADDQTDVDRVTEIARAHPEVEWALLYFPERQGTTRNPTKSKRTDILRAVERVAAHLCGEQVFRWILAEDEHTLNDLLRYRRVQVNINARQQIFTDEEVFLVYEALVYAGIKPIYQCHQGTEHLIKEHMHNFRMHDHDVLFDSSKGKGITPTEWPTPISNFSGYAGGLNPDNICDARKTIDQMTGSDYWLDMETGVRTDNQFDLDKVQNVLTNLNQSL